MHVWRRGFEWEGCIEGLVVLAIQLDGRSKAKVVGGVIRFYLVHNPFPVITLSVRAHLPLGVGALFIIRQILCHF